MLDKVIEIVRSIHPVSDELQEAIEERLEIIEAPKKTILLRQGQRADYLYVVLQGAVRMYYIKDEEEVCCRFVEELQISASVISFFGRIPGYEIMETIEDTTLARIHYDKLHELYKEFAEFNYIGRVLTETYFIRTEERLYLLRKHGAAERYSYFVEHYPSLYQRVPLKYIASYLGLTLETISRIRAKLSKG